MNATLPAFTLRLAAPDREEPPRRVVAVEVPAADGRLTVLSGHAPLVAALDAGLVRVRTESGPEEFWRIGPGVLRVTREDVLVLATEISPAP